MVSMNDVVRELETGKLASYLPKQAVIMVTGSDAQSFLSRLSTNDLSEIFRHGFAQTSFTNNKGRMIDHCLLFSLRNDEIILVSSHSDPQILIDWLNQFHFIEDVIIRNQTDTYTFAYLITLSADAPHNAFPIWSTTLGLGKTSRIFATLSPPSTAFALTSEAWETLRIMCLMPQSPSEINDGVMPHNINLEDFISEQKGCYIGQEVIAKARTYQKQVKTLCGIRVDEAQFGELKPGLQITNDQSQLGEITSVAPLYMEGEINALLISDLTQKSALKSGGLTLQTRFIKKND